MLPVIFLNAYSSLHNCYSFCWTPIIASPLSPQQASEIALESVQAVQWNLENRHSSDWDSYSVKFGNPEVSLLRLTDFDSHASHITVQMAKEELLSVFLTYFFVMVLNLFSPIACF